MKIKHILYPVDFSDCSRALNRQVEWVANHFDAEVTLLHVFEIPVMWYGTGEPPMINAECFQQFASNAEEQLSGYPIELPASRVNRAIEEGDVAWHINNWVEEHDVDLVMMGTHGYGSMRRLLLGSVAMKVLHDVSCPVWTSSPHEESLPKKPMAPSRILCALELTEEAVPLLRFVNKLAQDLRASVHLIHTVPGTDSRPYRYFDMDLRNYLKECTANDIAKSQHEAGTDFPVTITEGSISQITAAVAADQQADLVVIGRGKAQAVLGTLRTHAYEIIRHAPCSVLSYCSARAKIKTSDSESQSQSETALAVS